MTYISRLFCALPFALLAVTAPAIAQEAPLSYSPDLDRFEYGILCHYDDAFPNVPMTFPQVNATYSDDGYFDEVRVTKNIDIPGVPGLVIGVVSSLRDGLTYDVTSIITHTDRAGRSNPDQLQLNFDDQVEIDAWRFDTMNTGFFGTFRFQALRGQQTVYDVTLNIVPPAEYTGRYPECLARP